jgi:hypothetical protein
VGQANGLRCDAQAVLSHHSAGALWGLRQSGVVPVHVTHVGDRGRKVPRIVVHRARLGDDEAMRIDGLRVTTPARTIVDLAAMLSGRAMRETVERAQDLRRFHPDQIRAIASRRRGTRPLIDLIDLMAPDADNARTHLERLFLAVVRRARLPRPQVNVNVAGRERDRQRDRELTALNWRPVRFTFEDVVFEPAAVAADLTPLLRS